MSAASWVPVPEGSGFPVGNLPYGVFSRLDEPVSRRRVGVAIGDHVLDCAGALGDEVFAAPSLNPFMALGRESWSSVRSRLTELLTDERHRPDVEPHLVPRGEVRLHLPIEVADYVDFYASEQHASNVGRIFRPGGDALTPNWKHLPIGYHGRSGTVVVSGTPVRRPSGQRKAPSDPAPAFGPSLRLDIEAEVGVIIGVPSVLGEPVPTSAFAEHAFGIVLVNDWSARDIQAWEYVPLGPFLGKSFATSISPWVVTFDALEAARIAPPPQDPEPFEYLRVDEPWGLDLALEIEWNGTVVSRPPFRVMYWTGPQQLAHMTVNGASMRTGDLLASGTVSGDGREERGSFLELSWNGTEPVRLASGEERSFLEDGDTVVIRGTAPGPDGERFSLGEVAGTIVGQ
ncbi:MAG TPA: fumarylacetoacetase [Acidimicrobiales bacterium]|nr:fumarylacetoacetase [Acidimicrobiales bacterium]